MTYAFWISYACLAALAIWQQWQLRRLSRDNQDLIAAFETVRVAEAGWKKDFFELLEKVDPQQAAALREFEAKAIAEAGRPARP
jgi:cytochrome oxidase assembly protein ShyY1